MMTAVTDIHDLEIWQDARELVRLVYEVSGTGSFEQDFGLRDQIRKASVSSMANIAEGYARESDREFLRFLDVSRSSVVEVRSHASAALAVGHITPEQHADIERRCISLHKRINALMRYLRN